MITSLERRQLYGCTSANEAALNNLGNIIIWTHSKTNGVATTKQIATNLRIYIFHDDVIKWKHFSALLAICAGNSPVPVNSPHKGQWRGPLMFSFIYAWINDWVNNREAGDLRHQRGHYDIIVMFIELIAIAGLNYIMRGHGRSLFARLLLLIAQSKVMTFVLGGERYVQSDMSTWCV